jgi:hypothetical protein
MIPALLCCLGGSERATGQSVALAQNGFIDESILGWHVRVNAEFERTHQLPVQQAMALPKQELAAITTALPHRRLVQLRQATFWLDERVPEGVSGAKVPVFHPDRGWLLKHGLNPYMAGGIEIPNVQTFLDSYAWEPWAMMHELAHFYHHTVLGDQNTRILTAYRHAREEHLYKSVEHYDGRMVPAYARTNEREYFAELTEAYFGRNDFYPFTREQLQSYDAIGFAMVQEAWEAP